MPGLDEGLEVGHHRRPPGRGSVAFGLVCELLVGHGQADDASVRFDVERDNLRIIGLLGPGIGPRGHQPGRRRAFQNLADHVGGACPVGALVLPRGTDVPVGDVAVTPVLGGETGVCQGVPDLVRRALDIGDVHERGLVGHVSL